MRVFLLAVGLWTAAAAPARAETPHAHRGPEPRLESPSVFVIDEAGTAHLSRRADQVRPIASLTKLFAAMIVRDAELELDGWTEITNVDAGAAEGGAASALWRGHTFRHIDLLHAMLLVSDNRVPTALARAVGLSPSDLLDAMNALARRMGLEHTRFDDVTGITGNRSTARELALAMQGVLADPVLARILRTRHARIRSRDESRTIDYKSTVQPLWSKVYRIRGGKTGTTEAAGHCMVIAAEIDGHVYTMAFLGGASARSRFLDFAKVVRWLDR